MYVDRWTQFLNFIRGIQRPVVIGTIITYIVVLVWAARTFMDAELAKIIIVWAMGSGTSMMGYAFGERKRST